MSHVYEGEPDSRQSSARIPVSRFRPKYRALSDEEKALHDAIKAKAAELEALFNLARDLRCPIIELPPLPDGEQVELRDGLALGDPNPYEYFHDGMKSLELAVMWAVKGLTS